MTASIDQLRALPWGQLIAESKSTSCDDLHSTLMKWIRPGTLTAEESAIWHQVEPVLGLFIQLDVGADRPSFPLDILDGTPNDLLANLAAIASEIASDDVQARILDLAWLRKACDYKRVGESVAAYIRSAQDRLDPDHWVHTYGRLKRAIEVGASVGRNQAFRDAVAAIEAILDAGGAADPLWLSHHLMVMLRQFDVGDPAKYAALSHAIALAT